MWSLCQQLQQSHVVGEQPTATQRAEPWSLPIARCPCVGMCDMASDRSRLDKLNPHGRCYVST